MKLRKKIGMSLLFASIANIGYSQKKSSSTSPVKEQHGTCATTAIAPFGVAFIIDSRLTSTDVKGEIVSQAPGCKVLLARPTILLAGVGLEDASGISGKWNLLEAASSALAHLPENPTISDFRKWSYEWGKTLVNHYNSSNERPGSAGEVSEMLLITRIGGEFYFYRSGVDWNGKKFRGYFDLDESDEKYPQVMYSGACRQFVGHADGEGHLLPSRINYTKLEDEKLLLWGAKKNEAKSTSDLVRVVYGLESTLTQIDERLEGDRAIIAPPYATAQWAEGDSKWTTLFNAECKPNIRQPKPTEITRP